MTDASISASYDERAAEYVELLGSIEQMDAADRRSIGTWRDATTGRLLDAGCGPGLWTQFLHAPDRDGVGVDIASEFLASARERFPHVDFERASLRDLPFEDASFGGILAWYSLIHTPPADLSEILSELARVLAPGGSLLIGYFDGSPREPFAHAITTAYFWSESELTRLLAEAGLVVVSRDERARRPCEASSRPHGAVIARRA